MKGVFLNLFQFGVLRITGMIFIKLKKSWRT